MINYRNKNRYVYIAYDYADYEGNSDPEIFFSHEALIDAYRTKQGPMADEVYIHEIDVVNKTNKIIVGQRVAGIKHEDRYPMIVRQLENHFGEV